jgi:hypothetical protein
MKTLAALVVAGSLVALPALAEQQSMTKTRTVATASSHVVKHKTAVKAVKAKHARKHVTAKRVVKVKTHTSTKSTTSY